MSAPAISEHDVKLILDAANDLLTRAPTLVKNNPHYAVGSLSIALGTAAAMVGMSYVDLIDMLSRHYEQQLLKEIGDSLQETTAEVLLPKKGTH